MIEEDERNCPWGYDLDALEAAWIRRQLLRDLLDEREDGIRRDPEDEEYASRAEALRERLGDVAHADRCNDEAREDRNGRD